MTLEQRIKKQRKILDNIVVEKDLNDIQVLKESIKMDNLVNKSMQAQLRKEG